ncbi:MAG: hypothetical protein HPY61_10260 [Methanotrichaceae archaeon]|nr:hypothetical protein [Methanotrichaceae archaeon]
MVVFLDFLGGINIARREKLQIVACILNKCKSGGATKTRLIREANLNSKTAGTYLEWLIGHGYLALEGKVYKITPSGVALLSSISNINSIHVSSVKSTIPQ